MVCLLGCRGTIWCGCGCCGDCDACTVVCVASAFAARLLGCEGDSNDGVESGGGVVSAYMGGTCGSGALPSAGNVLDMSVVRDVGGVCDMCMCLARGAVGVVEGEWVTGLGLGFTNSGGTWGKWDMCLCFGCSGVGGVVGGELVGGLGQGLGGWGGVMYVCVVSQDSLC